MATETKVCGLARPENGRNIFCRKPAVGWLETPHGRVYICEEHRVPNMTTSEEFCACRDWGQRNRSKASILRHGNSFRPDPPRCPFRSPADIAAPLSIIPLRNRSIFISARYVNVRLQC